MGKAMEQVRYEAMHPEMYSPDAGIDRHKRKRVVPMEVLSLGMSRTGTACRCGELLQPHETSVELMYC